MALPQFQATSVLLEQKTRRFSPFLLFTSLAPHPILFLPFLILQFALNSSNDRKLLDQEIFQRDKSYNLMGQP